MPEYRVTKTEVYHIEKSTWIEADTAEEALRLSYNEDGSTDIDWNIDNEDYVDELSREVEGD